MVSTTAEAARMQEIVADNALALKAAGFKKRRHCFNREADDGLVHVVYFWQAPKEPPAWTEVPGLRERLYGKFRLDFGVHVPEMDRFHKPRGPWINDYDCNLRRTAGQLIQGDGTSDLWWSLDDAQASTLATVCLQDHGLPWLDSYPNAAAILDAFDRHGPFPLGMSPAGGLDIADLCRARGETLRERRVLEAYAARPILASHRPTLVAYLERHGHEDLIARITTREPGGLAL
jgi:hypothetical protein